MQVCHALSAAEPLETDSLAEGWCDSGVCIAESNTPVDRGEFLGKLKMYRYVRISIHVSSMTLL